MSKHGGHKLRLLVLTSTYPRWSGDPEPGFVHELSRRLVADFEVTVLGPHAPGAPVAETMDGVRIQRYRYAPVRLETLVNDGGIVTNLKRQTWKWLLVPGFLLGLLWATWQQIRRWRPDVIHAHWLLPQGLVVALLSLLDKKTPPFLVTSHGADLFALRARPLRALKGFVMRRAAVVTVVSAAMKCELQRLGVGMQKVGVQPMGVDLTTRFTPDPEVERSSSEILFVGRLVEKKGLRHLIGALPEILALHPAASLVVAGFGPEEMALRRLVKELDLMEKVRFLGALSHSDLPALYRRAAVFVAPFVEAASGDQEGLGLVVVEALGCGCLTAVSDLPATRDLPTPRFTPGSPSALAERICEILSMSVEQREVEAARLRRLAADRFDWRHVAAGYARSLAQLSYTGLQK